MAMKPITISVKQQKWMLALITIIFILTLTPSNINPNEQTQTLLGTQSFLTDIANDLGFDRTFSTATATLAALVGGMLFIAFFFKP